MTAEIEIQPLKEKTTRRELLTVVVQGLIFRLFSGEICHSSPIPPQIRVLFTREGAVNNTKHAALVIFSDKGVIPTNRNNCRA